MWSVFGVKCDQNSCFWHVVHGVLRHERRASISSFFNSGAKTFRFVFSLKSALEMAAYRWIIILIIGCSIVLPIQGWGNKEKCQLRLYAVQEFMVSNDVINDNTPARHQRRTDKSLSTVGKP